MCVAPQPDGTLKAARLPESLAKAIEPAPAELLALDQPEGAAEAGRVEPDGASDPAQAIRPARVHSDYHSMLQSRSSYE